MKKILFMLSIVLLSISTFSQTDTILLKECTINAYRASEKTPITFKNIDLTQINKISVGQEPSFILSKTPSVTFYSDAGSDIGYSYFRLRGIDQTRINMTFDGVPLNESEDQGVYFNNYPDFLNSVSSIQIQRGIGISTNGVASYGGSINFESPLLFGEKTSEVGFDIGSYHNRVYGEYNSGKEKNHGLYFRISNIYGYGYKQHSENESRSFLLSYGYIKNKQMIKLTGFIGHQENQMAWLGTPKEFLDSDETFNPNKYYETDNFLQSLVKLQHNYYISKKSKISSTIYYNYLNGTYDFDLDNFLYYEYGVPTVNNIGHILNYRLMHNFIGAFSNYTYTNKNTRFSTGIHINSFNRTHIADTLNFGSILPENNLNLSNYEKNQSYSNTGQKNELSYFSKIEYDIKKFTLFADFLLRNPVFNYKDNDSSFDTTFYFTNNNLPFLTTAHIGLNYNFQNNSLYTSIGRTEREPSRIDLFGGEDFFITLVDIDNEKVHDFEIGYRYFDSDLNFNFNLYYMDFKDGLVFSKYGENSVAVNGNMNFVRKGVEFDLIYDLNPFTLSNTTTMSFKNDDKYLVLSPFLIVNQSIIYGYEKFSFGVDFKYQSLSYIDYNNEFELDQIFIINVLASYKINKFNAILRINNLTNKSYLSNGYMSAAGPRYFIQAPLNFTVSIRYSF